MNDVNVKRVLVSVRELFSEEKRWTQGQYAMRESRTWASYDSPDAICWCLQGAIMRQARIWDLIEDTENYLVDHIHEDLTAFNDSSTYEQVISALDSAIASLS